MGVKTGLCLVAAVLASNGRASAQDYEAKSRRVDSLFSRYGSETPGRFEIEDGVRLVATQIRWGGTLTFTPTVKDEFRGSSQITRARFVRDAAGDITGVLVSGRRALNNRFVKLDRLRPLVNREASRGQRQTEG